MAILDSSFLIDILRNNKDAVALLDELEEREPSLFITAPSVMELWEGALKHTLPEKEKQDIEALLAATAMLPLDASAAKIAAEIKHELGQKGLPIEIEDVMIAGIARLHAEKVVTRDEHYGRIPGLRVLKY